MAQRAPSNFVFLVIFHSKFKNAHDMLTIVYVFAFCAAIDGDTLRCGDERVRLARIDTPEKQEPGFLAAKDHLAMLIRDKEVQCIVRKRERYGRLLGECDVEGVTSLSDEMLDSGLAVRYMSGPRGLP